MVRQWICRLFGGHDYLRLHERDRVALRCTDCGKETIGWSVEPYRDKPKPIIRRMRIVRRRTA